MTMIYDQARSQKFGKGAGQTTTKSHHNAPCFESVVHEMCFFWQFF